jgi:hypothetical protein
MQRQLTSPSLSSTVPYPYCTRPTHKRPAASWSSVELNSLVSLAWKTIFKSSFGSPEELQLPAMTNLVLARSIRELQISFVSLHRCYHVGRAGSVNTAIARGLRKSKGMGFRGKVKVDDQDPREKYRLKNGIPEYKSLPPKRVRPEMVRERRRERSKPTGFRIRRQGEYAGKQESSAKRVARDSKYADLRERLSVELDQEGSGRGDIKRKNILNGQEDLQREPIIPVHTDVRPISNLMTEHPSPLKATRHCPLESPPN